MSRPRFARRKNDTAGAARYRTSFDDNLLSRRTVLRSLGVAAAGAVTVGSVPTAAEPTGDTEFTKAETIGIDSFDGTTIEASLFVPDGSSSSSTASSARSGPTTSSG